jgi:PAS domain S-box-containing protein
VHRRADSSCYPIEVHLQLARHSGHPVVAAVILDVTTREQAEQEQRRLSSELLSKKRRFQSLVMHSSDLIALVGADARVKYLNPAFETILGYPTEDWIGSSVLELVSQEDRPAAEALLSRGLEAPGKVIPGLLRVQRADGSLCWMEGTATNYPDDSDTPGIVINARDVTERLLGEETTRQNEMRLRVAIDTAEVAVFEMDTDLRYTWIFHPQLGYSPEQVVGRTDQDLLGEDGLHLMGIKSRVLATGQRTREEVRVRHGGTESTFDLTVEPRRSESGAIVGLRGASLDISEAKALRAQFLHAQKLDTVGRLAGGIAHDFNNLLTVIDGAAQLAAMRVEAGDPMQADISEIRLASKRAASLTKQLLAFSRKQVLQPAVVNLNAVVTDVSTMLRRLIGVDIELRVRAAHDLGNVEVDRGQIEQVILNLVINARDAMSEGGLLAIETQDVDVKESAAKALSVPPGLYVMMTVSDTGVGMDEITRDRLFEPFFTTKPAGQGTGLGLSTVYGILRQSGGGILVSSELGGGCTIEVYLPRVSGKPLAEQPPADRTVARGTETILLVEDDHAVRGLACRFLELAGYRVLLAANGTEAIRLLEVQTDPVDLMITDIVMPGMGGMELAKRLAMIRPQLPVLFASGFSDHVLTSLGPDAHFIEKPYSMAELTQKVRSALDVTSGGPSAGRTLRSGARTPRVA